MNTSSDQLAAIRKKSHFINLCFARIKYLAKMQNCSDWDQLHLVCPTLSTKEQTTVKHQEAQNQFQA
jgi:hypothetical protein